MRLVLPFAIALVGIGSLHAAEPVDFSRDVRPILAQHCWTCHGPDEKTREAELRLDSRESAIAKKAIVPGDVKASKLLVRIDSLDDKRRMPPPGIKKDLTDRQKQVLRAWVEQGAAYSQHWAFTPPKRPTVPTVADTSNPIDAFVRERLAKSGRKPSPEVDRATLLRRVTLDLTGLPPTPKELDAFLADKLPAAYERVVDRLLKSNRHAERMAMAWLDAARFADTNGFNNDEDRTQWPWRDWLIQSFASNLPYDRFVIEQLAGDLLPNATPAQKLATAFLRNQVHNTEGGIIVEEYRVEYVADRLNTMATTFLGLSLQCARCHDHKYDPFTTREYYQMFAFFGNVSDKQASYAGNAVAEPFIKVPTAEQMAKYDELVAAGRTLHDLIAVADRRVRDSMLDWEKSLTDIERKKLADHGRLFHATFDEKEGPAIATSDPGVKGIVRGNAKWGRGKFGNALEFDGSTYVDLGAVPKFDPDGPFTVSLWAYPTANDLLALASKMDDGAAHRGFDLLLENGKVSSHLVNRWPDNAIKVLTKNAMSLNAWHHVLLTYDGSKKSAGVKIYIDGKLEATEVANDKLRDTLKTDKPFHVGRRGNSLNFKGQLDDVQMFGVELSAANATQLAAGRPAELTVDALAVPAEKRTEAQKEALVRLRLSEPAIQGLRTNLADVKNRINVLDAAFTPVSVMEEMPKPRDVFILKRGQYDAPGDKVSPGFPAVLGVPSKSANRLDLANWLVDPKHPLTARVAVNRWWEMYFGTGLVKTVEDFGNTGEAPSLPELLDFLATELIRTGWDVRAMQRLIVTSATYRQSSAMPANDSDPDNRLLSRGPRGRLRAESVRDNALAIAGLLSDMVGGPSVKPYQPPGLWEDVTVERKGRYVQEKGDGLYRRGMYTFWKRTCPPPTMSAFDAPNREVCVARRATTNTPLQALVLWNDPTYVEAARKLAERLFIEGGSTSIERLAFAYKCALSRPPTETEQRILMRIRDDALARFRKLPDEAKKLLAVGDSPRKPGLDDNELAAWTTVCSTILCLDETISKR